MPALTLRIKKRPDADAMRLELLQLRRRWNELPPGETLELAFDAARRATAPRPARVEGPATR